MRKWVPDGPCAFATEDGRYMINRSPQAGYPAVYVLVRLGTRKRDTWEDSTLVARATARDDTERKIAIDSLMEYVEA